MPHEPTIIRPTEPQPHPTQASPAAAPEPRQPHEASVKPLPPEAALAHSLHQISGTQTVASRIPKLKSSALLVLVFVLFAALQSIAMQSVAVSVFGAHSGGGFVTLGSAIGWVVAISGIAVLLNTKSTSTAKTCLLILGVVFGLLTIADLMAFSVIALAIDGVILWRTYEFYQSVEALEL